VIHEHKRLLETRTYFSLPTVFFGGGRMVNWRLSGNGNFGLGGAHQDDTEFQSIAAIRQRLYLGPLGGYLDPTKTAGRLWLWDIRKKVVWPREPRWKVATTAAALVISTKCKQVWTKEARKNCTIA